MTKRYSRDDLLGQLQDALDLAGANPARWPEDIRAQLSAFSESDDEAARLFAEAKALDTVLTRASASGPRPDLEARILAAASALPQTPAIDMSGVVSLDRARRQMRGLLVAETSSHRPFWGGAALLAASLVLGIFIGLTGQAIPTLRNIELLALNDSDLGIGFGDSLFAPVARDEQERL